MPAAPELLSDHVFVALDFASEAPARALVGVLGAEASAYKFGIQWMVACGPGLARELARTGKQVFLDLKLFEIPHSVAGAVAAAGDLGAQWVSVHASAGSAVLHAAVHAARPYPQLRVLALTVITSMDAPALSEVGVPGPLETQVRRLALLAADAGCQGVVASPLEVALLRGCIPGEMSIVTPGVQMRHDEGHGHARAATARAAMAAGASHVVVGRGVAQAAEPLAAFRAVRHEVSEGRQAWRNRPMAE